MKRLIKTIKPYVEKKEYTKGDEFDNQGAKYKVIGNSDGITVIVQELK